LTAPLSLSHVQQITRETIAVRQHDAVRRSIIDPEFTTRYRIRELPPGHFKRADFVVVTLDDQGRHLDRAQMRALVDGPDAAGTFDTGIWRGSQEHIQNPLAHGR